MFLHYVHVKLDRSQGKHFFSVSFRKHGGEIKENNLLTFDYQNENNFSLPVPSLHLAQLMLVLCFYRVYIETLFLINQGVYFVRTVF